MLGDGHRGTRGGYEASLGFNVNSVLGCGAHLAINSQIVT